MRWIALVVLIGLPGLISMASSAETADPIPPAPDHSEAAAVSARIDLDECVALALASHPRLTEYNARISEAHGSAVQAGLYPNPRVDSGNPQVIGPTRTGVYSIGLTQEVVRGGKLKLDRAAALEAAHQAEWDSVRKRFEVLTSVRQEFFSTLAAQRRKTLLQKLLEISKQSEKTSMNLFDAEQVSETDVLLLRVERRKAETSLQGADIALLGQRRQLAASIGVSVMMVGEVDGQLTAKVPDFNDDEVLARVMTTSPVIQIANLDVNRTVLLLRRAEVEPIQNLSVQAGTQYQESTANYQALVGLYVDVPLWNRNQGNIMAAHAAVQRSMAGRLASQQELTKHLADSVTRFRVAEQAVENYENGILPDAMRTLELVQKAYGRGQFEISRLLQTQRTVFEANLDYISALENRLNAAADIAGLLQLEQFP
ncbi:TolC family protein [Schlesneria paludicola]|uniref:TolC family protein n=1 Tax=Schlesneria paludicola TaxID=360056 RepID=UPI00029B380C|nr:TolC family protein [Schlesneria paludicola]